MSLPEGCGRVLDRTFELRDGFLDSLSELLSGNGQIARLAIRTRDSRLSLESYEAVLRRELLQLHLWSSQRLMLTVKPAGSRATTLRPARVFSLLPTMAPMVHLLRRAVPFASHGLPTLARFPVLGRHDGHVAVDELARVLGLEEWLQHEDGDAECLELDDADALVVATGRRSTLQWLTTSARRTRILGATGRCAVVIGSDACKVRRAYHRASKHRVRRSCTNVRAAFCLADRAKRQVLVNPWSGHNVGIELEKVLRRLHPSVVYWVSQDPVPRQLASSGYAVFRANERLEVTSLTGFGRDPTFHWSGDYCV